MSTIELDLVMTPDGIKKRVITPDDEMPERITYQGVEYRRVAQTRLVEICVDEYGIREFECECCERKFTGSRTRYCPNCGAKVVGR